MWRNLIFLLIKNMLFSFFPFFVYEYVKKKKSMCKRNFLLQWRWNQIILHVKQKKRRKIKKKKHLLNKFRGEGCSNFQMNFFTIFLHDNFVVLIIYFVVKPTIVVSPLNYSSIKNDGRTSHEVVKLFWIKLHYSLKKIK